MSTKVMLKDFFNDDCKNTYCKHNLSGYCSCKSSIHYQTVLEAVAETFGTDTGSFNCIVWVPKEEADDYSQIY